MNKILFLLNFTFVVCVYAGYHEKMLTSVVGSKRVKSIYNTLTVDQVKEADKCPIYQEISTVDLLSKKDFDLSDLLENLRFARQNGWDNPGFAKHTRLLAQRIKQVIRAEIFASLPKLTCKQEEYILCQTCAEPKTVDENSNTEQKRKKTEQEIKAEKEAERELLNKLNRLRRANVSWDEIYAHRRKFN